MNDAESARTKKDEDQLMGLGRLLGSRAVLLLVAVGVLASGCAGVANPQGWAGPRLAEDTLYVSIEKGKLAALEPGDLSVKWIFPPDTDEGNKLDLEGIYSTPIVNEGFVYFGAYDGNVYALDAATGNHAWPRPFETNDPIVNSLALRDGTLFAGSTDGNLYAIDAVTGEEIDRFDTGSSIWASPLVVGDTLYLAAMDGRLHALNAETLDEEDGFSFKTDAGLLMDPAPANDDTLLVGGIDHTLYALDAATGGERWSFDGGNWFWGRPLIEDGTAYLADLDGDIHAVDLENGSPVWDEPFHADAAVRSAPLRAGDTLVVVDRDGDAFGLDPDTGTRVWGPTLLHKTVLSDPFLLERAGLPGTAELSPSATPGEQSSSATAEPSPAQTAGSDGARDVVLIVAQGGDLCTIDPTDGSPVGALICAEVPL